jgi:hypothetical protein
MYLDFELCDRNQNVLTRLDNRRPGGWVEVGLDAARRGFCPLSLEDSAYAQAAAVETLLRVTLRGPGEFAKTLFIGRVIIPEQGSSEDEEQLGLNAVDPFFQLERSLIRSVAGAVWNPVTFAATDQSQIMWSLISGVAANDHGIVEGSLPASMNRDRTYVPGKEVGAALVEMSEVIGGPDFELEPVAGEGTDTLARFNTFYPRQGSDKSADVVFVHGAAPYTASNFIHAPGGDGIVNRVVVVGAPMNEEGEEETPLATFPSYVAEHAASIAQYGVFEKVVQLEDVTEVATLRAHAEGIIAASAYPIPFFDFTASPEQADGGVVGSDGVPPRFGIDYWIGDTIACHAYLGAVSVDESGAPLDAEGNPVEPLKVTGRITDAVITELESGQVAVKLSCSPEVKSEGITGEAITLLVPEVVEE